MLLSPRLAVSLTHYKGRHSHVMTQPKPLERVRITARLKHLSLKTEKAYLQCIKRFILFHNKRHPAEMGTAEIRAYLSYLAVERHVAASTQNVALAGLLFLYRDRSIMTKSQSAPAATLAGVAQAVEVGGNLFEAVDILFQAVCRTVEVIC